jgi:hypothetical protein
MIGSIPTVLKINKQINRVSFFCDPAFHKAIPLHTISRSKIHISNNVVHLANIGAAAVANSGVANSSGVMVYYN